MVKYQSFFEQRIRSLQRSSRAKMDALVEAGYPKEKTFLDIQILNQSQEWIIIKFSEELFNFIFRCSTEKMSKMPCSIDEPRKSIRLHGTEEALECLRYVINLFYEQMIERYKKKRRRKKRAARTMILDTLNSEFPGFYFKSSRARGEWRVIATQVKLRPTSILDIAATYEKIRQICVRASLSVHSITQNTYKANITFGCRMEVRSADPEKVVLAMIIRLEKISALLK